MSKANGKSTTVAVAASSPSRSRKQTAEIVKRVWDKYGNLSARLLVSESDPNNRQGVAHELAGEFFGKTADELAQERREDIARTIIRSVEPELIELGVITIKAPHYVRDPRKQPNEQGYVPLMQIKSQEEVAHDLMVTEIERAVAALTRAHSVAIALNNDEEAGRLIAALAALGRAPYGTVEQFVGEPATV